MKYHRALFAILITSIILFFTSCLKEEDSRTRQDEINELAEYLTTNNISARI